MIDPSAQAYIEAMASEEIKIIPGKLNEAANLLEINFIANKAGVYQRGGTLVEIVPVRSKSSDICIAPDAVVITPVNSTRLRDLACMHARFQKWDSRGENFKTIDCPKDVADILISRNCWQLPFLNGILGAPTINRSGELITKPGYDENSGMYLNINKWKKIKQKPTREDAIVARGIIEDLVSEFPFVDDASRSAWMAGFLTALTRWSLPTAPFFGFDAPVMGSGKSLLAELIGYLVNGHEPAMMSQPKDENETGKKVLAAFMAGDPMFVIDNIERPIMSEVLCTIATSKTYRDRLLGQTKMITVPTAVTIIMTGNNLVIRGDLSTRMLIARLDPGVEHPEQRNFKRPDIRQYVLDNRHRYVNAALTIMRAYEVAGRPDCGLKPYGRFEDWSARIRASLVWCGASDPCETRVRVEINDPEREMLRSLIIAWLDYFGDQEVLVSEMIHKAINDNQENELRDALEMIALDGSRINSRRLGKRISSWEGRVCDGYKLIRGSTYRHTQRWRLIKVDTNVGFEGFEDLHNSKYRNCQNKTVANNGIKQTQITKQTHSALIEACRGLDISQEEFLKHLSAEDLKDIESGKLTVDQLNAWAIELNK